MRMYTELPSPIGPITICGDGEALTMVTMQPAAAVVTAADVRDDGALAEAVRQLEAYFAGELRAFTLPLNAPGTSFQRSVWDALRRIPFGATASYGEIARALGTGSARAVGAANGQNPIGIIVPCHRVIGADGSLTGYAGGMQRKHWLLEHEARVLGGRLQGALELR